MQKIFTVTLFGILVFAFFVSSSCRAEEGNILYVGGTGTGNYSSIQAAVNAASNGDTVYVYDGTYYENIMIDDKSINLVGEDRNSTIIDGMRKDDAISISANNVVISSFTIKNSNICGVSLSSQSPNSIIKGNIIKNNNRYGIQCSLSSNNTIYGNTITDQESGIVLDDYSYNHAIYGNNNITGNTVKNSRWGIRLDVSNNNIITANILMDNDEGIRLVSSSGGNNTITANTFIGNKYGIVLSKSDSGNIISNNIFSNNTKDVFNETETHNFVVYIFAIILIIFVIVWSILGKRKSMKSYIAEIPKGIGALAVLLILSVVVGSSALILQQVFFQDTLLNGIYVGYSVVKFVFVLIVAIGLLKRKSWAWIGAILLTIINLLTIAFDIVVLSLVYVSTVIGILMNIVILLYLMRPHVRAYFGKTKKPMLE